MKWNSYSEYSMHGHAWPARSTRYTTSTRRERILAPECFTFPTTLRVAEPEMELSRPRMQVLNQTSRKRSSSSSEENCWWGWSFHQWRHRSLREKAERGWCAGYSLHCRERRSGLKQQLRTRKQLREGTWGGELLLGLAALLLHLYFASGMA